MNAKIVIATNHFNPSIGGSQTVVEKIANFLHQNNQEVTVITRAIKGRNLSKFKYRVREYLTSDYRSFSKIIEDIKPDVLFIYSDVFDFFRQILTSENKSKLIIATCGSNWVYSNKSYANIFYNSCNKIHKIICHSEIDRDYKLCSSGLLKNKSIIIPNGIDIEEFDSNHQTRDDLLPNIKNKRWVLNISNFFPGKGQEHLIDILNILPEPENLAYIQINSSTEFAIGESLENSWAKKIHTKLNKKINVVHKKNINRKDVISFLKMSNVFAFTSEKEVAPLSILESMAAKLPWVSTDVGNVKELSGGFYIPAAKNSKNHSVFDDRVNKIFASKIQECLLKSSIADDGRLQIEKKFLWNKILPIYMDTFLS